MATELLRDLMARSSDLTLEKKQRLAHYLLEQVKNGNGDEGETSPEVPRIDPRKGQL